MKKTIAMTICAAVLLCGCSIYSEPPKSYDAGEYALAAAFCEGDALVPEELYPEGGTLRLSSNGTGLLRLGRDECEVFWAGDAQNFRLSFSGINAEGTLDGDAGVIDIQMSGTGQELIFAKGEYTLPEETPASETPVQILWNGERSGRMWYEEADGEWSDYALRSAAVMAETEIGADGEGSVLIYCDSYSPSAPMARINVSGADASGQCRITDGYFMDLNLGGWHEAKMSIGSCMQSELRSEKIITFNGQYGHFFDDGSDSGEEDREVRVMKFEGRYESGAGSFRFYIEMT